MSRRILIAGTHSGSGKTTLTLAMLSALKKKGIQIASFKCGPDFIDPQFHRQMVGIPGNNLDPFMLSREQLRAALSEADDRLCVIEGVMGYYDGVGIEGKYSTFDVACQTQTPVILVINARGMYTSAGAIIKGFHEFKKDSMIRGVIFNSVSEKVYPGLSKMVVECGLRPLGFLPYNENFKIGSRHLGLLQSHEVHQLKEKLSLLGESALKYIDIEGVLSLSQTAPAIEEKREALTPLGKVRVAVASDNAFCFIYQENLDILRQLGAEIVFFSPLKDENLPEDIDALYLPGGYPELHLHQLAKNVSMRKEIRTKAAEGLPLIAEGGGYAYLHEHLEGHEMAGIIKGNVKMGSKLQHFGYHTLTALHDAMLLKKNESFRTHEYHYYQSDSEGSSFRAQKPDGRQWKCVHSTASMYAGFPYLFFAHKPKMAENFIKTALQWKKKRKK